MPMVGHLAENGLIVGDEFREGNVAPASRNLAFIKYCVRQMPKGERITALRSDSAAYQADSINYCEENGIYFAIGADLDTSVLTAIEAIPEDDWKPYKNGYIAETIHCMEKTEEAFRLIVIRRPYQGTLFSEEDERVKYTVIATPPGCIPGVGAVGFNGVTGTKTPVFHPLLTNTAAMLAGIRRYYNRIGRDVTMLAFAGDGGAADVGFQSLSGAAERGEQMIFICVDNEGYMNTGVQRSSTTPYGAWTSTTPVGTVLRGKSRDAKPMALLMVMHNCEYVATACMAFMEDYYAKLEKALEAAKRGMAYIHVFSPCPTGWRFAPSKLIEVSRKAVETNMVPLWEYEEKIGNIRFTHTVENPLPVTAYLSLIGKYHHLDDEQVAHIQRKTDERVEMLNKFAQEGEMKGIRDVA